jgi:hypothetical protein
MFYPPNPEQGRDRRANSEITRAQLGIQMAKLRESIRPWYRRLRPDPFTSTVTTVTYGRKSLSSLNLNYIDIKLCCHPSGH